MRREAARVALWLVAFFALLTVAAAVASAALDRSVPERQTVLLPDRDGNRVMIYGCGLEDECTARYRVNKLGYPIWVVRQVTP